MDRELTSQSSNIVSATFIVGLAGICAFFILILCVTAARAQPDIDEPFELSTVRVPGGAIEAIWKETLAAIDNDLSIVSKGREESCLSLAAIKFVMLAKEGERQETLAQMGHLNRAANLAIRSLDKTHADNEWRSPLAILSRGSGDCKHFAVLKYAMLRQAGVSPDAVKIIVVEAKPTNQLHAIVAVRTEKSRWLLLDSRTLVLVESSMALSYYDPLYEFDQNGVWQFALPSRPAQVAQSARLTQIP